MGINNDAILCYGIEFSYNEIKHLKQYEQVKKLIDDISCNFMPNVWEELESEFFSVSDYYKLYRSYIIGKQITKDMNRNEFLQEINENETVLYLKNICERYNLKYTEPKILCRVNIN